MNIFRNNRIFDMKFIQIPNIDGAWNKVRLKTLSPSSFSWICNGCAYQILLQKVLNVIGDDACSLPSHRDTILGIIIHRIYELTSKRRITTYKKVMDTWELLIDEQVKRLSETYPTLRNPNINDYDKRNKAIRYALTLMKRGNDYSGIASSNIKVFSEMKLACEDIGLYGIADKVIFDSGNIDIIDYKSGNVRDTNGNIRQEYIIQLHLYAAMCKHLFAGSVRSLKLIDIEGGVHTVEYDPDFSYRLLKEVKEKIVDLNNAVSTRCFQNLIRQDRERCNNCSCRHICSYMIQSDDYAYRTISGKVDCIYSSNMYVLRRENVRYYISGIDLYQIDNPEGYIGKHLVFLNVVRASQISDDFTYKVTENSLIYELL